MFRVQGRLRGLDVQLQIADEEHDQFAGVEHRLRQVLVNLLGNALKFTEHGQILLNASLDSSSDDAQPLIVFEIRDSGIGLPEDKIDTLFEPFTQADMSTTRAHAGTGLGPAIRKQFVELMRGRIWCQNNVAGGSAFFFTIARNIRKHA